MTTAHTQVYGIPLHSTKGLYTNRGQIPYKKSASYVKEGDCNQLSLYICNRFSDDTLVVATETTADATVASGEYHKVIAPDTGLTITLPAGTTIGESVVLEQAGVNAFTVANDAGETVATISAGTKNFLYRIAWDGNGWVLG